jgi:hypothetical protein
MPQQQNETQKNTDRLKLGLNIAGTTPLIISTIANARAAKVFKDKLSTLKQPFKSPIHNTAFGGMPGDETTATIPGTPGKITSMPRLNSDFKTIPNPKINAVTGKPYSIFHPERARQTQVYTKDIKSPLYRRAAKEAILREAESASKTGGGFGRAMNNAKISLGGTGNPAYPPTQLKPNVNSAKNPKPPIQPSKELQTELRAALKRLDAAENIQDVRSVVEDMNRMGKNNILGKNIGPQIGATIRRVTGTPLYKFGKKAFPWLSVATPIGLAVWENADAKSFAEEKASKMKEAGATGTGGAVVSAPTAPSKSSAANVALVKDIDQKFDSIGKDVVADSLIPNSQIKARQLKLFNEWLNSSKEHKDAFYSDPATYERYSSVINPKK